MKNFGLTNLNIITLAISGEFLFAANDSGVFKVNINEITDVFEDKIQINDLIDINESEIYI